MKRLNYQLSTVLVSLLVNSICVQAQRDVPIKDRLFQLSVAPALGTNGLHPGSFNNYFSLNLTSGYSNANMLFELGIISNLNVVRTNGLQIAGLANITGGNAFGAMTKKEREEKTDGGFSAWLTGAQISGLTNVVLGDADGAQVTGGVNMNTGALIGLQVSGLANIVHKYSMGVQFSGLFNVSVQSFNGLQFALLSNYTKGEMAGLQLGALNQARDIEGKNSTDNEQPTGFQIGIVNIARKMNGYQFGLVNFARKSQGTQVGLINIYRPGSQPMTRNGKAIGLVNVGDLTYVSVYANELFAFNYEVSTGTLRNGRIKMDRYNLYLTNALMFSHRAFGGDEWGLGYGLKRMFFNRSEVPRQGESKFLGYGIDFQHISDAKGEFTKSLNLLGRVKVMAGARVAPKLSGVNWFAALTYNAYLSDSENSLRPRRMSSATEWNGRTLEYWPGFSAGVLFH